MDNRIYKHLRRVIENEEPENSEAQRDLRGLLLTERKYSTLHPEEQVRLYLRHYLTVTAKAATNAIRRRNNVYLYSSRTDL